MTNELISRVRDRAASLQNGKRGDQMIMSEQIGDMSILLLELHANGCGRQCDSRFGWPACVAMVTVVLSVAVPVTLSIFRG
jgi:hypothetical protein